jgi:hypothetical protein
MFYATDIFKFPINKVKHVLFKVKGDKDFPYVNLRIINEKEDIDRLTFKI